MRRQILSLLLCLLINGTAHGAVLDWDTATWTPFGSFGPFTYNTGIDQITAQVTTVGTPGFTNDSRPGATDELTPNINAGLTGGLSPAQNNLQFAVNNMSTTEAVVLTLTFPGASQGVSNVSFTVFDVDASNDTTEYRDRVRVRANSDTIVPTSITDSANNTQSASGLGGIGGNDQVTGDIGGSTSDTSGAANATFTFTGPITSFTITYLNIRGATLQWIGIHDITYTPVPEPSTLVLCGLVAGGGWVMHRRRKLRTANTKLQAMSAPTP